MLRSQICTNVRENALGAAPRPLPRFNKPPVVEVAISVYFKPITGLKTAHFGRFWNLVSTDYPKTEDRFPIIEPPATASPEFLPLPRIWLISENETYLIQLQNNFFAHNWRKVRDSDQYPSFEHAKGLFMDKWGIFKTFVGDARLGGPEPTSYEVTYVNHFVEPAGAFPLAIEQYSPLISLRSAAPGHFLPSPKKLLADLQFDILQEQGKIRVTFKQGARLTDKKEVMQVDVTARKAAKADGSDMDEWLEVAHEWIVRGFTDLTTPGAHEKWERTQ
jgi:uncharacterized protein (TIGR04255 family)